MHWDVREEPSGDAFASRFESYLTEPGAEPEPAKRQAEVLIRSRADQVLRASPSPAETINRNTPVTTQETPRMNEIAAPSRKI